MATDPKDNKEAKDEKPKENLEELTEKPVEDVAGGRRAQQLQREADTVTRYNRKE